MLYEFSESEDKIESLRAIKNDLIGNDKKAYFNKGLIETVVPLLNDADPYVVYESIAILNSFLIDFPEATDVFHVFETNLQTSIKAILSSTDQVDRLKEMTL